LVGAKVSESVTAGAGWTITAGTATTAVSAMSVTRTNNNALVTNVVSIAATETSQAVFGTYNNFAVYGGTAGSDLVFGIGRSPLLSNSAAPYITVGGYLGNATIGAYAGLFVVGNAAGTSNARMGYNDITLISSGTMGFAVGTNGSGTGPDTAISRTGVAAMALGNGTAGDFSGGLKLTDLTINRAATFLTTSVALTNGAGASAGTITNAPAVGNPTKWIGINDNGTTRYIPAW